MQCAYDKGGRDTYRCFQFEFKLLESLGMDENDVAIDTLFLTKDICYRTDDTIITCSCLVVEVGKRIRIHSKYNEFF